MKRCAAWLGLSSLVGSLLVGATGCSGPGDGNPEPDASPGGDGGALAGGDGGPDAEPDPDPCVYPEAPAVMAEGEPLPHFSWPEALDAQRNSYTLDLEEVHCDTDADIDWSPFDALLFISIPAW